jgi:DNA processing protein
MHSARCLSQNCWPLGARELQPAPARLYLWGQLPPPPWVAIVGTRTPSEPAEAFAHKLAKRLTLAGVSVASGGAFGIDAAAHRGALEAGGATVVVAPSSFDHPYPEEHAQLYEQVLAQGGGYLARDLDRKAQRHAFFARNQLLVACAALVVIVEAPWRSGARNAALWARRMGRPLFVVPHPPWNAQGRGCISELKLGAKPLASERDVLAALTDSGWPQLWGAQVPQLHATQPSPQLQTELWPNHDSERQPGTAVELANESSVASSSDPAQDPLLHALVQGPQHLDQLQQAVNLPLALLAERLTELLLSGQARQLQSGLYALGPPNAEPATPNHLPRSRDE